MKELIVDAKKDNIKALYDFINIELNSYGYDLKSQYFLCLAIEEIFINIASYAYGEGQGKVWIQCQIDKNPDKARITFFDKGILFNPLEKETPDLMLAADDRNIGGLGIFLVKQNVDSIDYEVENKMNKLVIVKSL